MLLLAYSYNCYNTQTRRQMGYQNKSYRTTNCDEQKSRTYSIQLQVQFMNNDVVSTKTGTPRRHEELN